MPDEYSQYREQLTEGVRLEIGIPLAGGGVFREWAVVREAEGEFLLVEISRDVLPSEVRFDVGFILDISVRISNESYTCSAIVAERLEARVVRIRLFGSFTLRERRQFFRIDTGMRIKYGVVEESSRKEVEMDWEVRKEKEHMKFQGYDEIVIAAQMARYKPARQVDWKEILFARMNMSGGGVSLRMPQSFKPEQLMNLELFLPLTPPRQIHTVARVVHVRAPITQKDGTSRYDTGMQFVHLDERDRDLVFKHISLTQQAYLRKIADKRDIDDLDLEMRKRRLTPRQIVTRVVWTLVLLFLAYSLVKYLISYSKAPPPNQIEETYEQAIRKYRHLDRK